MTRVYEDPVIGISVFSADDVLTTASADTSEYIETMQQWSIKTLGETRIKKFTELISFVE